MNQRSVTLVTVSLVWLLSACAAPRASDSTVEPRTVAPTPPPIPACRPEFEYVTTISGSRDRVEVGAVSKNAAFLAAYFQGVRVANDGTTESIAFDRARDPAILQVEPASDREAWFLRREPWYFDGERATRVPVPDGITVDSMGAGGGQVWFGGKEGDAPAVLRRQDDRWERVPFSIERFEHLAVTVSPDGTPYMVVAQVVPKPPAPPGTFQTLELRTETSLWKWAGSKWSNITPPRPFLGVAPGRNGILYVLHVDLMVQRYYAGSWSDVPVATPSAQATAEHVTPLGTDIDAAGRLWIPAVRTSLTGQSPDLWLLDGEAIRQVSLEGKMKSASEISSVRTPADGSIWATADDHVFRGRCV